MTHFNSHVWMRLAKDEAWGRQNRRCYWCLAPMKRDEATVEHIKPKNLHGSDRKSNIAAAHEFCNKTKGSKAPKHFQRIIERTKPGCGPYVLTIGIIRRINLQTDRACKRILQAA